MTREELNALAATWPDCDYWASDSTTERLTCYELLEALEQALDTKPTEGLSFEQELREMWPDGITLYGFKRDTVDLDLLADIACDTIMDSFNEDYVDPDGDVGEPPEKLRELVGAAVAEAFKGKTAWSCSNTDDVELTLEQLIGIAKLEWPDWFESPSASA